MRLKGRIILNAMLMGHRVCPAARKDGCDADSNVRWASSIAHSTITACGGDHSGRVVGMLRILRETDLDANVDLTCAILLCVGDAHRLANFDILSEFWRSCRRSWRARAASSGSLSLTSSTGDVATRDLRNADSMGCGDMLPTICMRARRRDGRPLFAPRPPALPARRISLACGRSLARPKTYVPRAAFHRLQGRLGDIALYRTNRGSTGRYDVRRLSRLTAQGSPRALHRTQAALPGCSVA